MTTQPNKLAQVEGLLIVHQTSKAYYFDNGVKKAWVPVSEVHGMEPEGIGEAYTVTMSEWIALRKGLI